MWLSIFKHLLPTGRAWRLTIDKPLRRFFDALGVVGEVSKGFIDDVYDDLNPQRTRELDKWEWQFALPDASLTEQQRRDRLEATWKALGGQDPHYIQNTLQAAGFNVYVHEWWEPITGRSGGSINGDVSPVARNPELYINDGTEVTYAMCDGGEVDGGQDAMDGRATAPKGYPLVNKVLIAQDAAIGDGSALMADGASTAMDGFSYTGYTRKEYTIPDGEEYWPYFLYIGGETFPELATVPESRRNEFEDLCLKICPTEQWLGILVTYV